MAIGIDTPFYRQLLERIKERDDDMVGQLRTGTATTIDQLHFHRGYLQALTDIKNEADAIFKKLTESH